MTWALGADHVGCAAKEHLKRWLVERVSGLGVIEDTFQAFLENGFDGGRHAARVDKIVRLEVS